MKIKNKIKTSNQIRLERNRRALEAFARQQAADAAAAMQDKFVDSAKKNKDK